MRSLIAAARGRVVAAALVAGLVGLAPGSLLAQPEDGLVARCDLPVLELFNPTPGDALLPGAYLISGLALDPMAQQGASGVDQVSFFLGSRDQGGAPLGSVAPSGGARGADFSLSLDLPGA